MIDYWQYLVVPGPILLRFIGSDGETGLAFATRYDLRSRVPSSRQALRISSWK